eukprot:8449464-Alexandrium_andersonii.AAC.1
MAGGAVSSSWLSVPLVGHLLRGAVQRDMSLRVEQVHGVPPSQVNVYTDGSIVVPMFPAVRHGGCGIFLQPELRQTADNTQHEFWTIVHGGTDGG